MRTRQGRQCRMANRLWQILRKPLALPARPAAAGLVFWRCFKDRAQALRSARYLTPAAGFSLIGGHYWEGAQRYYWFGLRCGSALAPSAPNLVPVRHAAPDRRPR